MRNRTKLVNAFAALALTGALAFSGGMAASAVEARGPIGACEGQTSGMRVTQSGSTVKALNCSSTSSTRANVKYVMRTGAGPGSSGSEGCYTYGPGQSRSFGGYSSGGSIVGKIYTGTVSC